MVHAWRRQSDKAVKAGLSYLKKSFSGKHVRWDDNTLFPLSHFFHVFHNEVLIKKKKIKKKKQQQQTTPNPPQITSNVADVGDEILRICCYYYDYHTL